jgi:hypothetical protein
MQLLDSGAINLESASATSVLTVFAMNANEATLETWVDQQSLSRRTGLSLSGVKKAMEKLRDYLEFVRHRQNGIKVYRLKLPGLDAVQRSSETPKPPTDETAPPFDPLGYVAALASPVAGISLDEVRSAVNWHLEDSPDDYWRKPPGIKNEKQLEKMIPAMVRQFRERKTSPRQSPSSSPSLTLPSTLRPEWTPSFIGRKGEKVVSL